MPPSQRHSQVGGEATDLMDADISFPLARLFDPFNLDHVPENRRMDEFEHRDLAHIKHYKAAVKIFGGPLSRKRVIYAPPMETPMKHRLGLYYDRINPPPPPVSNSEIKPQDPAVPDPPEEIVAAKAAQEREDTYKSWFNERKKFRNNLESMGLNIDWLSSKPSKTLLERRVLRKLKDDEELKKREKDKALGLSVSRAGTVTSESSSVPSLRVPAPEGLKILEQHTRDQKLRLVDLFTSVDKNKDWKLSRKEFINVCKEKQIPLSGDLLDDMLLTLDMNLDDELDYQEIAIGMDAWRRQRREDRRKELSRELSQELSREATQVSSKSGSTTPVPSLLNTTIKVGTRGDRKLPSSRSGTTPNPDSPPKRTSPLKQSEQDGSPVLETPSKSTVFVTRSPDKMENQNQSGYSSPSKVTAKSEAIVFHSNSERTTSPNNLGPPPMDLRAEQLVFDSEEAMLDLRKRNRDWLKGYNSKLEIPPNTIKSGSRAIDNHSMKSTMEGDIGELVDSFRQKRLEEFHEIVKMCENNNIVLSQKLMERVLLYPPERPHEDIKKFRPPDSAPLISSHFADPPKRPRTPLEVKHKDKVRRSRSGNLLIDSRHKYPMHMHVAAQGYKQNLSTGRAVIRRKTDCWMTFEDYERMTRHLAVRYQHLHGKEKTNAFWPGHLLDKLRLCMPPYDRPSERDKEHALYSRVHRTPAVNYKYEPMDVWRPNKDGIVQVGIHDHYRHKGLF